jgi:hypothetical protein
LVEDFDRRCWRGRPAIRRHGSLHFFHGENAGRVVAPGRRGRLLLRARAHQGREEQRNSRDAACKTMMMWAHV